MAASGIRIVMLKLHVPPQAWLYLVIGTSVGVIAPMIAHVILQRFGLLPAFGLAPLARRRLALSKSNGQVATSR
jgi:hypothetical protein